MNRALRWFFVAVWTVPMWTVPVWTSAAEPLRYRWSANQQFAYQVDVGADLPGKIETLSGRIFFQVKSAGDPLKVTYRGGLLKVSKDKEGQAAPRGPFGPPFGPSFRPPIPGSPFARSSNPFKGLETTTNEISLTSRGEVLAMEGSSQLPYLLGNLSLLVFEPLPDSVQNTWTVESGITITEGGGGTESRFPFGPRFDPFDRSGNKPEKTTSGGQTTTFTWESQEGALSRFRKTYQMTSPGDSEKLSINGSGTWTFNSELGVPEALDFTQKVVSEESNTTVTIPVTIKFRRLTAEEMAKIDQERLAAEKKLREDHERRMAEQAEAKKALEAPLDANQQRRLLAELRSGNSARMVASLQELAQRSPAHPDPEVAAAIAPLASHANGAVKGAAEKALRKWSPGYRQKAELNKAYQGPAFVQPSNRPVTAETQLFVGQIVVVDDTGAWYPAEITGLPADGSVEVTFRGWGNRKKAVARARVQLAPEEVDQPHLAPSELALVRGERPSRTRTWTDSTGRFKIRAEFLRLENGKVMLKRVEDGREVGVPLEKLAAVDRTAAEQLAKESAASENPFNP